MNPFDGFWIQFNQQKDLTVVKQILDYRHLLKWMVKSKINGK